MACHGGRKALPSEVPSKFCVLNSNAMRIARTRHVERLASRLAWRRGNRALDLPG